MDCQLITGILIAFIFILVIILSKIIVIDLRNAYRKINFLENNSLVINTKLKYFQRRANKQSETILVMLKRNALLSKTMNSYQDEIISLNKLLNKET